VLTDIQHSLFCNNEDWSNPNTRIWFIPGETHYGCAYVGFDNGWAQGGLNTEGLAFDWVAGYQEKWQPTPAMKALLGNPSRQMLETCANISQAIQFYRTHRERSFANAKILIADRTGASVIIGSKDGQLQFDHVRRTRGFGFGAQTLDKLLAEEPAPSVDNGERILRSCLQQGQFATKYSNIYDLRSKDIFLFPDPNQTIPVKLNLDAELKKGGHYYDMAHIHEQQIQPIKPLLENMRGTLLELYKPIPDAEPQVRARIQRLVQDISEGKMRAADYSTELWQQLSAHQADIQGELKSFGPSLSPPKLVDRSTEDHKRGYRYRLEFQNVTLLMRFVFDDQDKVSVSSTEAMQ
jgi:hypothetical protein